MNPAARLAERKKLVDKIKEEKLKKAATKKVSTRDYLLFNIDYPLN